MTTILDIRPLAVDAIIDLRWRVLRAGLPRETAGFDGDHESTTHHFAATAGEVIVGCVTILQRPWQDQPAWQLRGMAVEPAQQGSGIGRRLVEHVEDWVRADRHSRLLWCNARVPAAPFYQRMGWAIASEEFVIPTADPHVKMTRRLEK